jgi:hypothetical protein
MTTRKPTPQPDAMDASASSANENAAERLLMAKMGVPDALPQPTRSDAAFVSALREELSSRRAKSAWRVQLAALGPALAGAAALAFWMYPAQPKESLSVPNESIVASAISSEHAESLFQESMAVLDEEDLWLDSLDDESLLAFHDSLER